MSSNTQTLLAFLAKVLGVYVACATLLNKTLWPKPAPSSPKWERVLHAILIDGPAALPSKNLKGLFSLFGLELSIPFVALSGEPLDPTAPASPKPPLGLVPLLLAGLLGVSACAHGTDGLRQGCANADAVLQGSYGFAQATMQGDLSALRDQVKAKQPGAAAKLAKHELAFGKALSALDSAEASKSATCGLAPAIDAGMKADLSALEKQLGDIVTYVQKAVADLKEVLQ